jgi:Putative auto-transporter adhesin, head GIN domain
MNKTLFTMATIPISTNTTTEEEPQNLDIKKLDSLLLQNKKILLLFVPVALIIVGLLIAGFVWVKHNFLDGRKADIGERFTSINYNVPYNLNIYKSDKNRVEISNNENPYYDKVDYYVLNGELKIKGLPNISVPKRGAPTIVIYAKEINHLINNDEGNIIVDAISGAEVNIESKDKGNIEIDKVESETLVTTVRSSGDIKIKSGKTTKIEANVVNAGGKIDLTGVESPTAKTKDIGTGTIKLNPNTVDETKAKSKDKK